MSDGATRLGDALALRTVNVDAETLAGMYLQGYEDGFLALDKRFEVPERTCENASEPKWKHTFCCSRCGYECDMFDVAWCPGCGARVVG